MLFLEDVDAPFSLANIFSLLSFSESWHRILLTSLKIGFTCFSSSLSMFESIFDSDISGIEMWYKLRFDAIWKGFDFKLSFTLDLSIWESWSGIW